MYETIFSVLFQMTLVGSLVHMAGYAMLNTTVQDVDQEDDGGNIMMDMITDWFLRLFIFAVVASAGLFGGIYLQDVPFMELPKAWGFWSYVFPVAAVLIGSHNVWKTLHPF